MATRFYIQVDSLDQPVTPAFDAGWESTQVVRSLMRTNDQFRRRGLAPSTKTRAGSGVSGNDVMEAQFISYPLRAQTISGTVSGVIRSNEAALTDNYNQAFVARVVSGDGSTFRGTLLASYGGGTEFPTASSTIFFPAGSPAALSSVDAQEGDRLVVEFGFHQTSTSVANAGFVLGDGAATDYALTEGLTTVLNPWIEFSQDLNFQPLYAPESFYYTPQPLQIVGNPFGYAFFTLPRPVDLVVSDVLVPVGAALALGTSPIPLVLVELPQTASLALGSSPAPVVKADKVAAAALGLGSTPAEVTLVTVFPNAALALGSTPAPTVNIGYIISVPPAIATGATPAPVVQVVKSLTAALAAGSSPAQVVNVVVPLGAALALGVTPAPTVIIAGNVTVTPAASIAIGSTPTPVVQVLRAVTAATALGVTVSPSKLVTALVSASNAQGITPTPTVIAGVLLIAASVGIIDQVTATAALTSLDIEAISVADATGTDVVVVDGSGATATAADLSGDSLTITDQLG